MLKSPNLDSYKYLLEKSIMKKLVKKKNESINSSEILIIALESYLKLFLLIL